MASSKPHQNPSPVGNASSGNVRRLGIIMNGVTGRMGTNQHLIRSVRAIIAEGGIKCPDGTVILPEPILVGRNISKLQALAQSNGIEQYTTDLDDALDDERNLIYFDAQTTNRRVEAVTKAIEKGKHVYCEKPIATTTEEAMRLYHLAKSAGVKHGVVQDKLFLPGLLKLRRLLTSGSFGQVLAVKGEFGYWVFDGINTSVTPQRPSWNYRAEEGGGIIYDMLCHWRYVIDNLFGEVKAVSCLGRTHVKERVDEDGKKYVCTADDAAYAQFELKNGVTVVWNSSWATRVRRDDLLTVQVDGTKGSAVAGLRDCRVQHESMTPRPVWNPDVESSIKYLDGWASVPDVEPSKNAFKVQWEMFLRHVVLDEPFKYDLLEGAKGVQLAELGIESWKARRWVDVPVLE
jgi:predicted dehydrogenase